MCFPVHGYLNSTEGVTDVITLEKTLSVINYDEINFRIAIRDVLFIEHAYIMSV